MLGVDYIDGMKRAETEASQWLLMAAHDLKADVSAQAAICGCTEVEAMLKAQPLTSQGDSLCFEIARCVGLRDSALQLWEENKHLFKDKLHKVFEGNPTGFLAYQKLYPEIMEWAGVTEAEAIRLTNQTLASIETAYSYIKVGRMWGLDKATGY